MVEGMNDRGLELLDPAVARLVRETLDMLAADYCCARVRISAEEPGDDAVWLARAGGRLVVLNAPLWTPDKLEGYEREWADYMVDASPEGVVAHEFGHVLFHEAERMLGMTVATDMTMESAGVSGWLDGIAMERAASIYGQENCSDFVAEAFCAHHYGRANTGRVSDESYRNAAGLWDRLLEKMGIAPEGKLSNPGM